MIDTSPPMIVPCLLDPFAFGDVVPPEIFSGSEPLVNSLRVPFSSKAPKKQPLDSTSVVYRGPPMIGPFGWRAPLLKSLCDGLQGNPLEAIANLLPADYMKGAGRVPLERLMVMLIHDHYMVSPSNFSALHMVYLSS
jgi:hypothetical protein